MQVDKITFNDISIFHQEEEFSIFHKLNFTRTLIGKEWLRRFLSEPQQDIARIIGTQNVIKTLLDHTSEWPEEITNGTIMMMDKFLNYNLDPIPENINWLNAASYKILHVHDYAMIRYSVKHMADFYRGIKKLSSLFASVELPKQMQYYMDRINKVLLEEPLQKLSLTEKDKKITIQDNLYYAQNLRNNYKNDTLELMEVFGRLEAWYSMARAVREYNLHFPEFVQSEKPFFKVEGLRHLLLTRPVAYDLVMNPEQNFLFLTGANMAGKSTLIKAVGSAVFLAHLGMAVPAKNMQLTLFDGLLTNINVADNIAKGESYFFNEVQRIKNTIQKINDGRKWLVLIDELFKGTNVQDAMKCSTVVIKGLAKMRNSIFILSTHLYEIGEELKQYPNIAFKFFETNIINDQLDFSYQLKEGISNDRIGYVILKREKVVDLLESL